MSRKWLKQNKYNHRTNLEQIGSKRRSAVANLKTQGVHITHGTGIARVKCSTCGTEIVHPYVTGNGVVLCALCAVKKISASKR